MTLVPRLSGCSPQDSAASTTFEDADACLQWRPPPSAGSTTHDHWQTALDTEAESSDVRAMTANPVRIVEYGHS